MKGKNRVLFYASVSDKELFNIQQFYVNDIKAINKCGLDVKLSNSAWSFLNPFGYRFAFLYFYRKSLLPAIIARILCKKVVFTGGVDDLSLNVKSSKYKIQRLFFNVCYLFSTACLVVSSKDMDNIKKALLWDQKKLVLSHHSLDLLEEEMDINKNNLSRTYFSTICWMGSVDNVKRKGVDVAIKVYARLVKHNENYLDYSFIVIGQEGVGTEYLKEVVRKEGLEGKVVFLGSVSEVKKKEILKNTKLYFQISTYEGFGLAALEALQHGCTVVHSGRGGLSDTVRNLGFRVSGFEPNVIAEEIICSNVINKSPDMGKVAHDLDKRFSHAERSRAIKQSLRIL